MKTSLYDIRPKPLNSCQPRSEEEFFKIDFHSDMATVIRIPPSEAQKDPQNTIPESQLINILTQHSIPTIKITALTTYLDTIGFTPKFARSIQNAFAKELGSTTISKSKWRGTIGEVSANSGGILPRRNLNSEKHNSPIFDSKYPRGRLVSVKTSSRATSNSNASINLDTYLNGLSDILGGNKSKLLKAAKQIYPLFMQPQQLIEVIKKSLLAVNDDHVKALQDALQDPANYKRKLYERIFNLALKQNPTWINGIKIDTYRILNSHINSVDEEASRKARTLFGSTTAFISKKIISNGITTEALNALEKFRYEIKKSNPGLTEAQIEKAILPEQILMARHGGGALGTARAAGIGGMRGAAAGAGISVFAEGALCIFNLPGDKSAYDCVIPASKAAAAGAAGGFTQGGMEVAVNSTIGGRISLGLASNNLASQLNWFLSKAPGTFAGSAIGGGAINMAFLALDDKPHSSVDYAAVGVRGAASSITGGLAAALATGVTGAICGSSVPVAGTIVGFIVGFGASWIAEKYYGAQVEEAVRSSLQE
ncbi:hypothetical protein JYK02_05405 [Corallococcus macrosporus]|uniref:Uncharacterized protein n=1 Tax=Corallococcus macrosporus TaxID=35 RepID=A0ABS3D9C5_9BACT|nr:hypothetical protein [Corallococcus macrosporus]MBN8226945.1 hypothetical protein [Corallococcus macrosporus]